MLWSLCKRAFQPLQPGPDTIELDAAAGGRDSGIFQCASAEDRMNLLAEAGKEAIEALETTLRLNPNHEGALRARGALS